MTAEQNRLDEAREQTASWKKWGPYLSERQWGTVREDYSEGGNAWDYFTHDQARSRAIAGARTDWPASPTTSSGCACAGLMERQRSDPQRTAVWADQQRKQSRRGRQRVLLLPR